MPRDSHQPWSRRRGRAVQPGGAAP